MAKRPSKPSSKPTIAQIPASGKSRDFKAASLKQGTDARPAAAQLPGAGVSAKLVDHLKPGAHPTVNRPSLVGKSTGSKPPQNKRGK